MCSTGTPSRILCDGNRWRCAVDFKVRRIIPRRMDRRNVLNSGQGMTTRKDGLDKRNFSCTIMRNLPRSSRPQCSQHNHWDSSTSNIIPLLFWSWLKYSQWGERNIIVIMKSNIISSSATAGFLQRIYSVVKITKTQKVAFHFLRQCVYSELPSSFDDSVHLRWSVQYDTSRLTSMLFSCKSFNTSFSVSLSMYLLRNPT